jgi:hypothetical protein
VDEAQRVPAGRDEHAWLKIRTALGNKQFERGQAVP